MLRTLRHHKQLQNWEFFNSVQWSEELRRLIKITISRAGLLERVGGLDTEAEWGHQLSLGEQQRVAFLRLLLHAPGLAFLDEATGALDTPTESALYSALRAHCRSYVSVGACRGAALSHLCSTPPALHVV